MLDEITRKTRDGIRYTDTEIVSSKADPLMRELVLTGLYNFIYKLYLTRLIEDQNKEDLIQEACTIMIMVYNTWQPKERYKDNQYSFYKFLLSSLYNRLPMLKNTKYSGLIQKPYLTKEYIKQVLDKHHITYTEDDDLFKLWTDYIFGISSINPLDTVVHRDDESEDLTLNDVIKDTSNDFSADRYYTRNEIQYTMRDFVGAYKNKVEPVVFNTLQNMLNNEFVSLQAEARKANIIAEKEVRSFTSKVKRTLKQLAKDFKNKGL